MTANRKNYNGKHKKHGLLFLAASRGGSHGVTIVRIPDQILHPLRQFRLIVAHPGDSSR